ncbi:MAG: mechanosensitive ion channel, partial [Limnobacter sp.]|nr:mechanosensitive ion channel [Limnobacter sp.]
MQNLLQRITNSLPDLLGFGVMIAVVLGVLWALHRLMLANRSDLSAERRLPRQLALIISSIVGLVLITLALPVSESTRNQVLGLIGVLLSGLIAFSSTTIVGNLMAGLMMRFTQPFRIGDFIRVESLFGRVTETGLLDTEIQTEQSELISIPN